MKLSRLKLTHRFALLLAVMVAGFAIYGIWSFGVLNHLKVNGPVYQRISQGKDLTADILPPPLYIIESYLTALQAQSSKGEERKQFIGKLKSLKADHDARHDFWAQDNLDATLRDQLLTQSDTPAQAFYREAFDHFVPALESGDEAAATASLDTMRQKYEAHRQAINKLVEIANQRIEQDEAGAKSEITTSTRIMALILLASTGAVLLVSLLVVASIRHQLGGEPAAAVEIAGRIAEGDLTVSVDVAKDDDDSLMYALQSMRNNLARIVSQVRSGTDTIVTASSQISAGNHDLSSRTEEQAASLEETASSMEELTGTVKQNADNARDASALAVEAADIAGHGGEAVAHMVETMDSINESSRKIVDIISVIDGIAFQTNILALNAAVEAARAGEQGRGFAVVATEVRNLAQRSAGAAKEIKTLINDSVDKIGVGSQLAAKAGNTMEGVVRSVNSVAAIIQEITQASHEQSSGIEQINRAMSQMDTGTQHNASQVEEAAAAAEALHDQAESLLAVVKMFKTGVDDTEQPNTAPSIVIPLKRAVAAPPKKPSQRIGDVRSLRLGGGHSR